jgi:hypothetical protein
MTNAHDDDEQTRTWITLGIQKAPDVERPARRRG